MESEGGRLLDAVDAELLAKGDLPLVLSVMSGNTDALRLYSRRGLEPGRDGDVPLSDVGRPASSAPDGLGHADRVGGASRARPGSEPAASGGFGNGGLSSSDGA